MIGERMRGIRGTRHGKFARGRGALLACALATSLAGCVTLGPDYQRPDTALPQAWRSGLPNAKDVVNTDWWKELGDPALDALIDEAIAANKDLQLATLRVEEFDAKLQVTRADGRPQVVYSASAQIATGSTSPYSPWAPRTRTHSSWAAPSVGNWTCGAACAAPGKPRAPTSWPARTRAGR
jgi:outer membrane protein TolC